MRNGQVCFKKIIVAMTNVKFQNYQVFGVSKFGVICGYKIDK
jgi:hypothetical protein